MPFAPHHFICTQRIEMHGDKSNFTEPNFMAIFDIQHKESNFTAMNRGATGSTNTQRDALKYLVTNQKTGQIKSPKTPYRRIEYAPNPVNQIPPRCFHIHRDESNIHRDESNIHRDEPNIHRDKSNIHCDEPNIHPDVSIFTAMNRGATGYHISKNIPQLHPPSNAVRANAIRPNH